MSNMEQREKKMSGVGTKEAEVLTSPTHSTGASEDNLAILQTRTRRLFNEWQLFALSLMYMSTWSAVPTNMYYAMNNGGPSAYFFSYLVIGVGAMCQVASFSELASIQPIAGAQYYWTYHFAPAGSRRFLTWIQGWVTWTGYVATFASSVNFGTAVLEGIIQLNYPDYVVEGWRTTLISLGTLAVITLINLYAFRVVPWFDLFSGVLNILLFVAFMIIFLVMAPKNGGEIFTQTNVSSGWTNSYYASSQIGSLSNVWLFIGFEAVIHMGEETKNAKKVVPQSLFWSIFSGVVMGFVTLLVTIFCMPPVDVILDAASPVIAVLMHVTRSQTMTTALGGFLYFLNVSASMGNMTSVSRLTWAWARDGALPRWLGHVDGRYRIPFRAVWLTSLLVALLTLLNLGSETYIALGAITSLSSMAMYLSYAVVFAVVLHARSAGEGIELGPWNLGRWGRVVNVAALVYTVYVIVWLPFPQTTPVDASTMNYSGPMLAAVLVLAVSLWMFRRHHWEGPNRAVVDIALKAED
ncbi:amino acid permease [Apiospora arundinis]|uniref:Amino acid permease n=1 Tax=Apiospora arundinis TaxID=335852 RepID=A0ABR2I2Y6_9PEZI